MWEDVKKSKLLNGIWIVLNLILCPFYIIGIFSDFIKNKKYINTLDGKKEIIKIFGLGLLAILVWIILVLILLIKINYYNS